MRVIELFAGIGSQRMALRNLGISHKVVAIAEIDKYALKSYEAIHGDCPNLGDISKVKVEDVPQHDLLTYSFPCQDISLAGLTRGFKEGSDTRSSLLWECKKIIDCHKPKYLLLENVKNLVGKSFKADFDEWLEYLDKGGYCNYWAVLNAKDYGIPQNRERVFVVSIRKDINAQREPLQIGFVNNVTYEFPQPFELELRLEDLLEKEVDEKYYLSDKMIQGFLNKKGPFGGMFKPLSGDEVSGCLTARYHKSAIHDPYIKVKSANKQGYEEARQGDSINLERPDSTTRRGRVGQQVAQTLTTSCNQGVLQIGNLNPEGSFGGNPQVGRIYSTEGLSPTLTTMQGGGQEPKILEPSGYYSQCSEKFQRPPVEGLARTLKAEKHDSCVVYPNNKIRKFTPLECWRLMKFTDEDFFKAKSAGISDTQLYRQAGNSICVNVLEEIFKGLFK